MTQSTSFHKSIEDSLKKASSLRELSFLRNEKVGLKPGGLSLKANWTIVDTFNAQEIALIFSRFQEQSGSTEEKLISLLVRIKVALDEDSRIKRTWLVLGGEGWSPEYLTFIQFELPKIIPGLFEKIVLVSGLENLKYCDFSDF